MSGKVDTRQRDALLLPTVTFFDREARHTLPSGGGTTCDREPQAPIESQLSGALVKGATTGLLFLLVSYSFSCLSVVVQEFEFRRDVDAFRTRIIALSNIDTVDADDVVGAVRDLAASSGVDVDAADINVIVAPIIVDDGPGRRCRVAALPIEFDRLSVTDRQRFEACPVKCDETRWIVGFRANARASSLLTSSRFTVERYTWVDGFSPGSSEVVAAR